MPASWPLAIKDFVTYQDQPGPDNKTIIYAVVVNEMTNEVESIEKNIGARPYMAPGMRTLGLTVEWLWLNKAPLVHSHVHWSSVYGGQVVDGTWQIQLPYVDMTKQSDDHSPSPQSTPSFAGYVRTDGLRGFTQPVASPPAWNANQLVRLDQVKQHSPATQNDFVTVPQFEYIEAVMFGGSHVTGTGGTPWMWGAPPYNTAWRITGGWQTGFTDYNGNVFVPFNGVFQRMILTFNFMRMPDAGRSHYGYIYQYMEDQLILQGISTQGAIIQFREDNAIDRQAWITFTWIAVGF
jgi:hypothetical protein